MSDRLRALMIGCGKIAGGYNRDSNDPMVLTHALAYVRHPDYTLAACVDPDGNARRAFMTKWGVPSGYSSLTAALDAEAFDIASVCSPTGTHLAALSRLLESDVKAVFAEKPLDGDAIGARNLAARFAARGIPAALNFTRRFDPAMHALKAEIANGRRGELRSICGWYGSGMLNTGSHMLDLVAFLTGIAPRFKSVGTIIDDGVPDDPTISATLDLAGAPFQMIGCDGRSFTRFEVELVFANGIVALENGGFFIRRRPVESALVGNGKVAARGIWEPSRYGEAMLQALDELKNWSKTRCLSSDIASGLGAIALADDIHCAAGTSKDAPSNQQVSA